MYICILLKAKKFINKIKTKQIMASTKVLKCKCDSDFQDSEYGKGNRLHNVSEDGKKAKCTVCGTKKEIAKDKDEKTPTQAKK